MTGTPTGNPDTDSATALAEAFDPVLASPVGDAVAALERALDLADERLPEASVNLGRDTAAKVRERARHGTDHTLVALLGATGGGKSSLTNAIVGGDVATTGVRRPTTSSTLASYWGDADPHRLLDWLEVPNRHRVGPAGAGGGGGGELDGLVLLDVPDHDSVALSHRLEMERIAHHADLMVWVTDPEKYADEAMHAYLRQLRHHGAVTAMVLNKADQLSPTELERCRADLHRLLVEDGMGNTPVVVTAAAPAGNRPETAGGTGTGPGIGELLEVLAEAVRQRRAVLGRLEADLRSTASTLLADLGPDGGADQVPKKVARRLTDDLVAASGLEVVTTAVEQGHKRDAAAVTGWPFTRWVRSLRPHPLRRLHLNPGTGGRSSRPQPSGLQQARSAGAIRDAVAEVTNELPHPWPELVRTAATPDADTLNDRLDQAIATSTRSSGRQPRWWRLVGLLQWLLAAAVIAGAAWLGLRALAAYFQIPFVPIPYYRRIPIPTGLLVGGVVLGLLVAMVARRLASVGARRRKRAVHKTAAEAITGTVAELIVDPMNAELSHRGQLRAELAAAGGTDPVPFDPPAQR